MRANSPAPVKSPIQLLVSSSRNFSQSDSTIRPTKVKVKSKTRKQIGMRAYNISNTNAASDLESAIEQDLANRLQGGQSADDGRIQQEMKLLTELLNQSGANGDEHKPEHCGQALDSGYNSDPTKNLENALEMDLANRLLRGDNQDVGQGMNLLTKLLTQTNGDGGGVYTFSPVDAAFPQGY
jgi:hypothetical protein